MIRSLHFRNFKSFCDARMKLEPLTIVIGSNASGKSNALDGLRILAESSTGMDLGVVLDGYRGKESSGIRGGSKSCPRFGSDTFTLGATVDSGEEGKRLYYEVSVKVGDRISVQAESLHEITQTRRGNPRSRMLYQTVSDNESPGDITVAYDNRKNGPNPRFQCLKFQSVLSQVAIRLPKRTAAETWIHEMADQVMAQLQSVLFLDPIPQEMRDYVPQTSVELSPSAGNLSAVLAKLMQEDPAHKGRVVNFLRQLPDQEICDVDVVRTSLGDVMLQVQERAGPHTFWVDARGLSDGTLRSLAIVTALLSEKPGSLVVIEEVDNGLHPSRARSILSLLSELCRERDIHLLVTTHNPALLNAVTGEEAVGVLVCYRDRTKGDSRFVPLVDLDAYLRIAAHERIGDAMESGEIARAVRGEDFPVNPEAVEWLKSL
ncbi:MAG: AAA family ATPase [Alicyclobacillus macrosporangiidus]|uniref:AAA family ATPase n=1 Tax=Alicyclobacillus macrosporangiidus TaxID=392015 RepID=UPI0026ED4A61|nr:ATP-binding protein [Alicyclobacillus macrosporangiidus]MCL6598065.1 AAA family ATPase [Alicyclobacillus macrosporangiidus]